MNLWKGILIGVFATAVALAATNALAGSGIGGVFNLGKTNSVNATSSLTGKSTSTLLNVINSGTGTGIVGNSSGGPGLEAIVKSGIPPLKVNSSTQVANLNASLLGGRASSYFLPATGTAANSAKLGGIASTGFMHGAVYHNRVAISSDTAPVILDVPGVATLSVTRCRIDVPNARVQLTDPSNSSLVDVWEEDPVNGGTTHFTTQTGWTASLLASDSSHQTYHVAWASGKTATFDAWIYADSIACVFSATAEVYG
jgi:hypothetical protein